MIGWAFSVSRCTVMFSALSTKPTARTRVAKKRWNQVRLYRAERFRFPPPAVFGVEIEHQHFHKITILIFTLGDCTE